MSDTIEEISVTGTRGGGSSFDWGVFEFDFDNFDFQDEDDSGAGSATVEDFGDQKPSELVLSNGLTLKILDKDGLPVQVQNALLYIADNLNNIPALKVIFDELKSKGLSEVVLVADDIGPLDPTGAYAVNPDGSRVTFAQQEGEGETVRANTVWFTNSDGTDSVTITFNTNAAWASNGLDWAVEGVVHEVVHAIEENASEASVREFTDDVMSDIYSSDPDLQSESGTTGYSNAERGEGNNNANSLTGGQGHDYLTGEGGNDTLYGKVGNDLLVGGAGNDALFGAAGDDELVAGSGYDEMYGGSGNDKYVIDVNMYGGIGDAGGSDDYLEIQITSSVSFDRVSSKLLITDNNTGQALTIWNWFNGQEIENISLANGNVLSSAMINQIIEIQNGGGGYLPPIVLDLDGDGLELTNRGDSKTKIDLDDDGKKDETGWVSADDGILVFDQNGNGKVDGVDEFRFTQFGENSATDLQGLASFDENGDGLITSADSIWSQLLVWQDQNQNGKSSDKELSTLDDLGITSISVVSDEELQLIEENVVFGTSQFTWVDGTVGTVGDVALQSDIYGYEWQENSDLYNKIVEFFE